jgi:hypothetical protein
MLLLRCALCAAKKQLKKFVQNDENDVSRRFSKKYFEKSLKKSRF